jgi:hypothetical protein
MTGGEQVRRTTLRRHVMATCPVCPEWWEGECALEVAADHAETTGHTVDGHVDIAYRFEAVTG